MVNLKRFWKMQSYFIKIWLGVLFLSLFISCAAVNKIIPKERKPFQEKPFDVKTWHEGDPQTRGEMAKDLRWKRTADQGYLLDQKGQPEILTILGEPDRKTRGKCCGAGGTSVEEVWLYDVEIKNETDSTTRIEQFQIYFTPNGKVDTFRISKWDDKNPDYFPRVG